MGRHEAGGRELRSWHNMNQDREYDLARSLTADNSVPSNSPPRSRSPRFSGRRRSSAVAAAAAAAAASAALTPPPCTLEEVLTSGCALGGAPRPRPRPRLLAPAQDDDRHEAGARALASATAAVLPVPASATAAAAAALGLSFSAPAFTASAAAPGAARERSGAQRGGAVSFNLMAVGGTGLGKSTLLHAMFANEVFPEQWAGPWPRIKKTVQVETSQVAVREAASGLRLRLTLVDTPGIGDAVDNSKCLKPILACIDGRYYDYFKQETDASRRPRPDRRIHCCLYFIEPTGHGLKRFDIECMRKLHDRVNIVPVIAKADTMTTFECYRFKRRLLREIAEHQIHVYDFPEVDAKDEELKVVKQRLPFAVVSSNTVVEENGRQMLARRYPWGIAEIENQEHSDFSLLRKVLLQTHLHDLKEATNVHYESFRCRKLAPIAFDDFKNWDGSRRKKLKS